MYSCVIARLSSPLVSIFFFLLIRRPPRSTLFLHDALPIWRVALAKFVMRGKENLVLIRSARNGLMLHSMYFADEVRDFGEIDKGEDARLKPGELELAQRRSEEHTSELQSRQYLVCRLLLEK